MSVALRRAVAGDEHRLALLGGATFLTAFAHDHPGDALVAHVERTHSADWYAERLADRDHALWIVETDLKAPIGYALMLPPELPIDTAPGDLELKRLYILGPWQRDGWGKRLLDAAQDEAKARGAARLYVCVYTSNFHAQRFYEREGFADTGARLTFMVGDAPFDDQIRVKPL